jgi:ketosteroid isomerase-like protein
LPDGCALAPRLRELCFSGGRLLAGGRARLERETYFGCFHPGLIYRSRADELDAGLRKGLDELKRYTLVWLETFDDLRFDVREWIDLGDQVIGVAELRGRGRATAAPVRGTYAFLWTLRGGRIVEGGEYGSTEEALKAASPARSEAEG